MGLIIKPKGENKIVIKGTSVELPEVYGRVEFAARANGKTIECSIATYASKQEFKSENPTPIATTVLKGAVGNVRDELPEGTDQTIQAALEVSKAAIEKLGFEAEIG
jgi:hypothetical protein